MVKESDHSPIYKPDQSMQNMIIKHLTGVATKYDICRQYYLATNEDGTYRWTVDEAIKQFNKDYAAKNIHVSRSAYYSWQNELNHKGRKDIKSVSRTISHRSPLRGRFALAID
jgi:hypothetical protein